jgi:hypothetical protein
MPAIKKLTTAALLAAAVSIAGCNSGSKATESTGSSSTSTAPVAANTPAASAPVSDAAPATAAAAAGSGASATAACPLTATQVTAVMGETYGSPTTAYGICTYASSDNALTIDVLKAAGDNDFAGTLATAVQDNGTSTTTVIPAVGDKATGVGLEIVVQSGSHIIDIRNADSPGFGSWPKSTALAKLVIASLH